MLVVRSSRAAGRTILEGPTNRLRKRHVGCSPSTETRPPPIPRCSKSIRQSAFRQRLGPVSADELTDGQEPTRLGAGPQLVAASGVAERGLGTPGLEIHEAGASDILV